MQVMALSWPIPPWKAGRQWHTARMVTFRVARIIRGQVVGWGIYRDDPPKPSTLVVEFNNEEQAETYAERLRNLARIKGTF